MEIDKIKEIIPSAEISKDLVLGKAMQFVKDNGISYKKYSLEDELV